MNSFIIEQLKKANVIDATGEVRLANLNTYTLTHDILVIITDVVENNETVSYLRAVIDRWTMQDKAMGEQFITFNLTTEAPVEWAVGDYCYFRGERYTLNYIPSVTQGARTRTAQNAYTYDSVKMDSFLEELTRCEILDIVSTSDQHDPDLGTNYTGSSKFKLFCGENIVTVGGEPQTRTAVCTLADKIQVNLDRMYGVGTWQILVNTTDYYTDATGRNVLVTHTDNHEILFDHKTAAEALAEVHNTFDLNYYYEGNRVIKIGYDMGNVTDADDDEIYAFGYGQGYPTKTDQHKGLFELRKISNSQQQIVTRLRVYGSTKNLPYKWYFDHYDNLPQSLIINNLQLPDTFLPEGDPVNPDPNTKRAHNATRPTLRAVLGPKNDAYIDKNDDAASCPEGIREASVAFDGSNSELEEIYPSIEGVTFEDLRQATGLKDLNNITTPNQNAFAGYNNDEDINTLLAVGYTQGGVLFDDANVGSGILPKEGDTMPGSIFQVPYSTSGFETLTEGTNYYYGQEQTLFTVTPTKKGKYFIVPVLGKEPYFNFYTPTGSLHVGFIIKVKQGSNVIAQYQSDYSAINSGYFELPTIPDVFNMEDARTPEINVTTLSSHSITFTPIVKKETSGLTVQLSYNISAQGETWAYVPEYDWCAASQVDSSNEPFHIFVKDMGFDINAQFNGETPKVVMKTGDCVGREFVIGEDRIPITYQGKKGYRLTLTRASDSSLNTYYPSESYQLKDGDYFVLTGIDMPEAYINAAEVRLLRAATVWMAENGDTKFKYQPAIDDIYLKRNYDNMVAATPPTPEKSVFWRLRAGRTVKFRDVPSSTSGQPSDITVKIDTITITMGAELTRKVEIMLNDDITQSVLQKTVESVSSLTTKVEALGTGFNSLVTPEMLKTYTNTNFLSKVHDDVAAGAISTRKWFIGMRGVIAGGVGSLNTGGGGGQGTVTGINFAGSPGTIYEPSEGIITLPDYPSLSGYATESYVGTYFSSHFTQSSIKTTLGISDWALASSKPSYNFSEIGSKPTTLAGYGITDANITSGVITLGGNTITPATLVSGKIPLSQIPDAILGQMLYGGTVDGSGVVTLSQNAKDKWGITTLTLTSSNYSDYEGAYFIASANGSSGVPSTLGVLTGDWVVATASGWGKIDNTDAVTGVKGDAETNYRIGNVNITKANIGLGNVENTKLSTWAGTSNITTLGTITTGVWHGTAIADSYIASASAWNAKYDKPSGGIPKTDLASAVQTSLGLADTALQSHQTIYSLIIKKNGTQVGNTYNPATGAQTIDITDVASASALSGVTTRVGTLEGYFDGNGNANNAINFDGHDSSFYATATGLSGVSTRVGTLEGYFSNGLLKKANHYSPASDATADYTASATGATAAWSIDVVKAVQVQRDSKGHILGITVTSGKIPAKPSYAFSDLTSHPDTLSGYSITDGVNDYGETGSGNAYTGASISGHKITFTKGATFKTQQTAKSDPTASGTSITFIDTISQNANGEITATKKTVRDASASQSGVVSTSAQTFAGDKTFTGHVRSNKSVRGDLGVIAGGVGSLSMGGGGGTGTVTSVSVNNGTHTLPDDEGNVNLVLAAVALSGNYNDLSNKPTIPTKASWNYDDRYVMFDTASQGLTDTQKANARTNIGAGTSNFTGYTSSNKLSTDYINNVAGWTSVTDSTVAGWGYIKTYSNTARLQVSDTTNKRINTKESTGNYLQFTGGTNKFTISDGTNSFEVGITPSVTFPVTSVVGQTGAVTTTQVASALTNAGYKLTDTTYESKAAASGGTAVSLVTTGEKYTWNNKGTYSKPSGGIPASDLAESYYLASNPSGFTSNTGTVTSISLGTGLSDRASGSATGPITTSGTIYINDNYVTMISHGNTAYGWGNHSQAGYLLATTAASTYLPLSGGTIVTQNDEYPLGLHSDYTSGNGTYLFFSHDNTGLGSIGFDTNRTPQVRIGESDSYTAYTIIHSGNIGSQSVSYATTAGSANSVAWGNVSGKPSFATVATTGSYNDLSNKPTIPSVSNATITIKQTGVSDQTFTLNGSATTITLADTNTWRPLGTGASDACAGNDSRLSNSRPASDVYSWAKQSQLSMSLAASSSTGTVLSLAANSQYCLTAGGTAIYFNTPVDTTYSAATTSTAGLMSAADKTKLNGIATGATAVSESTVSGWGFTKNTGTVTSVKVGSTSYSPSSGVVSLPAYPTTLPASDVLAWAKKSSLEISLVGSSASSGVIQLAANTQYCLNAGGSALYFNTPQDTNTWRPIGTGASDCLAGNTKYAGASTQGGAATSANKLNTNAGSATNPVYFSGGVPVACTYSLNKTVPSDAVFTDHTYNFSGTSFTSNNSSGVNANDVTYNAHTYYTSKGPATSLGASTTDGALYSQAYSTSWVAQIAQDYRNGRLFVRGKNNGTWQSWLRVGLYSEIPTNNNQLTNGAGYITGNQTITLSGDVSGSGTTSISVSIGSGKVTNAMLAGSIANGKLANSAITIAGTSVSLGSSISASTLQSNLGLGGAAYKAVVTSVDTSASLPTSNAVKTFVEGKGYVTSSGVTSVATGTGLTGGTITGTGTISINSTYQTYISHGESAYNSLGDYLPKTGGILYSSGNDTPLTIKTGSDSADSAGIAFMDHNSTHFGALIAAKDVGLFFSLSNQGGTNTYTVLHSGNKDNYTFTPASHTHGNIQNGGTLQSSDIAIASGDKLVVTDSSNSSKIARTSLAFDGSTITQALTKKGTFENVQPAIVGGTTTTGTTIGINFTGKPRVDVVSSGSSGAMGTLYVNTTPANTTIWGVWQYVCLNGFSGIKTPSTSVGWTIWPGNNVDIYPTSESNDYFVMRYMFVKMNINNVETNVMVVEAGCGMYID